MSIGTGIFLSSIVFALLTLFSITRDRWNWKNGLKRIGIGAALTTGVAVACYFLWTPIDELIHRPKPFTELGGIALGAKPSDVKFLRGLPIIRCTDTTEPGWELWVYPLGLNTENKDQAYLSISFKEPYGAWSIRIQNVGSPGTLPLDNLDQFSNLEWINKRFGPASAVESSEDDLARVYVYRTFNLRVEIAQGVVKEYGIYHPKQPDVSKFAPGSKRVWLDRGGKEV